MRKDSRDVVQLYRRMRERKRVRAWRPLWNHDGKVTPRHQPKDGWEPEQVEVTARRIIEAVDSPEKLQAEGDKEESVGVMTAAASVMMAAVMPRQWKWLAVSMVVHTGAKTQELVAWDAGKGRPQNSNKGRGQ